MVDDSLSLIAHYFASKLTFNILLPCQGIFYQHPPLENKITP